MENKFIENLLNRPSEYKVGQIWHIKDVFEDVVITEVNSKIAVKIAVLSADLSLRDLNDVIMTPKDVIDDKIYGASRSLVRITERFIMTEELAYYKTTMKPYMIDRMTRSLTHTEFKYSLENYKKIDKIEAEFSNTLSVDSFPLI